MAGAHYVRDRAVFDNPYQSPVEPSSPPSTDVRNSPRHLAILRRGRASDARMLRCLSYLLFGFGSLLAVSAAINYHFAAEWNPETGEPFALISLVCGVAALFLGMLAILLWCVQSRNSA